MKLANRPCTVCDADYSPKVHNQRTCSSLCSSYLLKDRLAHNRNYAKEYYEVNKERIQARVKARHSLLPEIKRAYDVRHRYSTRERYFKKLLRWNRSDVLSLDEVISLLKEQDYRCAISGIAFTREQGSIYNPSIDRIIAGGSYAKGNIQLVCKCINTFRCNIDMPEFITICHKISENNK